MRSRPSESVTSDHQPRVCLVVGQAQALMQASLRRRLSEGNDSYIRRIFLFIDFISGLRRNDRGFSQQHIRDVMNKGQKLDDGSLEV